MCMVQYACYDANNDAWRNEEKEKLITPEPMYVVNDSPTQIDIQSEQT